LLRKFQVRLLLAGLVLCHATGAKGLGLFSDAGTRSLFLVAPPERNVGGRVVRAKGSEADAAGFVLRAVHPVEFFLLSAEISFWNLSDERGWKSDFGDLLLRARAPLAQSDRFHLYLVGSLRTGTGTKRLYPFSSGSVDVELGLAGSDTLSQLVVYGSLALTKVNRRPQGLERPRRHDDFVGLEGGTVVAPAERWSLFVGGRGEMLLDGGSREIYFTQVIYRASPSLRFRFSFEAEGGQASERAVDFALTGGIEVYY